MGKILFHYHFYRLRLKCVASAFQWISFAQRTHPFLEADESHRLQSIHSRHISIRRHDDCRKLRCVEKLLGTRSLDDPEIFFVIAQANRMRIAQDLLSTEDVHCESI